MGRDDTSGVMRAATGNHARAVVLQREIGAVSRPTLRRVPPFPPAPGERRRGAFHGAKRSTRAKPGWRGGRPRVCSWPSRWMLTFWLSTWVRKAGGRCPGGCAPGVLDLAEVCRLPERAGPRARLAPLGHPPRSGSTCSARSSASRATSAVSTASASTPGAATTACSASAASCWVIPITIATPAPTGSWTRSAPPSARARIYEITGTQFLTLQHALPAHRGAAADAAAARGRHRLRHHPRHPQLLADRRAARGIHVARRRRRWSTRGSATGPMRCCASWTSRRACCRRSWSPARCSAD